jgi:hypothetical protein
MARYVDLSRESLRFAIRPTVNFRISKSKLRKGPTTRLIDEIVFVARDAGVLLHTCVRAAQEYYSCAASALLCLLSKTSLREVTVTT